MAKHLTPLVLAALCLGCNGTPPPKGGTERGIGNDRWFLNPPPNQTLDLDEFEHDWKDLPRDDKGIKESYAIALWVTERHNAAMRCLRQEPPARLQAAAILNEVLERVPDSSKDRKQLALLRFREAAYWFRAADAISWHMDVIRVYQRTAPPGKSGRDLTEAEVRKALDRGRPVLKEANNRLREKASEALRHFNRYRGVRPDDRGVIDFVWKLHFYLQQYQRAIQYLDLILSEFDKRGVDEKEPLRLDYAYIRTRLQDYLANLRIQGRKEGQGPFDWNDRRGRELRRGRIGGN